LPLPKLDAPRDSRGVKKRPFQPPSVCPVCGEDVPRNAKACPECGADEETGWKEGADIHSGLDLPGDEDFDYDRFVEEEFGSGTPKRSGRQLFWWLAAVVVLAAFVLLSILGRG
jgi:hypothetical protein